MIFIIYEKKVGLGREGAELFLHLFYTTYDTQNVFFTHQTLYKIRIFEKASVTIPRLSIRYRMAIQI